MQFQAPDLLPVLDWHTSQYKVDPLTSSQYNLDPFNSSQYKLGP